ncbi:MAG: serine hydrolase domain-containing protein [Bacteroidota bacterium]
MIRFYFLFILIQTTNFIGAQNDAQVLRQTLTEYAEASGYNGNFLVAQGGKIVFEGAFGYADFDEQRANDTETVFRLASVSKQFTALGIALLEADGKLSFDDPLVKHIPEMEKYADVTIRQLIHHYGGIPDYMSLVMVAGDTSRIHDNETIIDLFADRTPKADFKPGKESEYSNTGYLMLASVIERVNGQSYGAFLKERVFGPLGMSRTHVPYPTDDIDDNRAWGYEVVEEGEEAVRVEGIEDPVGYYILANIVGDGMVHSTLGDLFRYTEGMRANRLLPADKARVLLQAGELETAPENGYAFGQAVSIDSVLGMVVDHSGAWAGYITYLERHPEKGNAIIAVSNNGSDFSGLQRIAKQYLKGQKLEAPRTFSPVSISLEELQTYAGRFQLDNSKETKIEFSIDDEQLVVDIPKNPTYPLTYSGEDYFYLEASPLSFRFIRGDSGEISGVELTQGEIVFNGEKL